VPSLIKGFPTPRTPRTKQNVDPAVYYVYSRVKIELSTKSPQTSEPSTICLSLKRGRSVGAAILLHSVI
jgi:hypothetical protein